MTDDLSCNKMCNHLKVEYPLAFSLDVPFKRAFNLVYVKLGT